MHNAIPGQGTELIASSAGVLFTRVAAAAAHAGSGEPLRSVERGAVESVVSGLRSEVDVLRGRREATVVDEPAYALAGFTLGALARPDHPSLADDQAAEMLEELITRLESLLADTATSQDDAEYLKDLFLSGGDYATLALSTPGERSPLFA
ncbi:hypothetical protein [Microbacterium sp.]|uniref:Uncharacterized protein n=1 Tax=Microbacterium laevaniformans TaxID=36807 RepID=A0A150HDL0_9MICO|nr:hypothetical protein Mlaev_02010 [Microbacterium laevaniformans]